MSDAPDPRSEKFLSRWSRRKQAEPEIREREDRRVSDELAIERGVTPPQPAPVQSIPADLPAVETLTADADFSRFMRADVPAATRNAAMKKLFGDPHFNLMDGLDIYIDDYSKADPIPLAMLKDLAQSRMLHLFDDDEQKLAPAGLPATETVADAPAAGVLAAAPAPAAADSNPAIDPDAAPPCQGEFAAGGEIGAPEDPVRKRGEP